MLSPTQNATDRNLAYLFFRVFLGINIGVHGASRIYGGVATFATELVSQFAKTPMPSWMVYAFGISLPFAEALVGVLIFVGLWSRLTSFGQNNNPSQYSCCSGLVVS